MSDLRALMVCYNFPPWAGGASARQDAFARYLPRYGIKPIVLTIRERYIDEAEPVDCGLVERIGLDVPIIRTRSFEPSGESKARMRRRIKGGGTSAQPTLPGRALGWIRRNLEPLFLFPDFTMLWAPFAMAAAVRLKRDPGFDVVYSAAPPYGALVTSRLISLLARKPLVIDIKDSWINGPVHGASSSLRKAMDRACERSIVRAAARTVTVTQRSLDEYRGRYSDLDPGRFAMIRNGVDPIGFSDDLLPLRDRLVMTISGLLDELRDPRPLFRACLKLIREGKLDPARLRIVMPGQIQEQYKEFAVTNMPDGIVSMPGQVPHAEFARMIQTSHLLVLISSRGIPTMVPAKLYEYVFARRSILSVAEPGAAADMIMEHGLGRVISPDDEAGAEAAIEAVYRSVVSGTWRPAVPPEDLLRSIDRRAQAGDLAKILRDAADQGGWR